MSEQALNSGKTVSFSSSLDVQETLNVVDYTSSERQACWVSTAELSRTRSEVRSIAKKLSKRQRSSRNKECTRGVEAYTDEQIEMRLNRRTNALLAVFEEQEHQWLQSVSDNERIAFVYKKQTETCQRQARQYGEADRAACEAMYFRARGNNKQNSPKRRHSPVVSRVKPLRLLSAGRR